MSAPPHILGASHVFIMFEPDAQHTYENISWEADAFWFGRFSPVDLENDKPWG